MSTFLDLKTPYKEVSLIGAGAGSGKTYHIQKTIVEWIEQGHIQADRILAVTFTNAAANEMKERIRLALMSKGLIEQANLIRNSQISTIHGFGLNIIERFSYEQGLSPLPRQLTESEQDILIKLSLSDISIIETILDDLKQWGYKGNFNGNSYSSAVDLLRKDILGVIHKLRIMSLDANQQTTKLLINKATQFLKNVYKEQPFKEETLNKELWTAIQDIKNIYSEEQLMNDWGSNNDSKKFIKTLFDASEETIKSNWNFWVNLQSIETAPKIFNKKTGEIKHKDGELAFNVWHAADKLQYHPGPLRQAIEHITILIQSAVEALIEYQTLKANSSLVDFGDMVDLSEKLLSHNSWIEEIKQQFDCVIIDEFQDTNPLQFSLLWKIQQAGVPALVVGDIKQSIMGFQGSDARLFSSMLEENKSNSEELKYNWRSSNEVMTFINALGKQLYNDAYQALTPMAKLESTLAPLHIIKFDKNKWTNANRDSKDKLSYIQHSDTVIANHIFQLLNSNNTVIDQHSKQSRAIRPNDIALLANSHSKLMRYSNALREFGITSQVKQKGWFNSALIKYLMDALSVLANPNDQYAKICVKVIHKQESTLEHALIDYINQQTPKSISSVTIDALTNLNKSLKTTSVKQIIVSCIDTLNIFDFCVSNINGEQERANTLKLISLAEKFEITQPESLEAQGIYGRNLSCFILWLNINHDDFDTQPDIDSNNENAVVLSTWHASKGLEWPVVLVGELEKQFTPSLPNTKITYELDDNEESVVSNMLENAYTQIIPNFIDPVQKKRFEAQLLESEQNTLKNLCYVAMTRAREQLILPWFDADKDNNIISLLRDLNIEKIEDLKVKSTLALVRSTDDIKSLTDNKAEEYQKPYGRILIKQQDLADKILARVSPSTMVKDNSAEYKDYLKQFKTSQIIDINQTVNLDEIRQKNPANIVGDWIHYCYQTLLSNPLLENRLFKKLNEFSNYPELIKDIITQISQFKTALQKNLQAIGFEQEVPILTKSGNGATISGIIDCLVELERGYIIIDHKTDEDVSDKAFEHHTLQLSAYAKHLNLDKPIIGVGINWVRTGNIKILSIS
ncbi:MAG: UvrD-helicase domain-containing protein [Saccharospirillaceae bacterium]|nr:UvrD-helicase domain-containing protein [Pseudomonadales bacterium]NRB78702.1 UvrD-helicase domain-containing protein [Saccharospirillaceae bacterium]